jgi:hypothetical protein
MPVVGTKETKTDWNILFKNLLSQAKARDEQAICRIIKGEVSKL